MSPTSMMSYAQESGRAATSLSTPSESARASAELWIHEFITQERARARELLARHLESLRSLTELLLDRDELDEADLLSVIEPK